MQSVAYSGYSNMRIRAVSCLLLLLQIAPTSTTPVDVTEWNISESQTKPTIWLAGDSTTAPGGGHNGTEGWGQYLQYSFDDNARVNNSAYAGRSARSFTREGRFDRIAEAMKPGDFVIIELGINDPGTPTNGSTSTTGDKGRADCPGAGNETCTVIFKYTCPGRHKNKKKKLTIHSNVTEVLQTFPTYIEAAARKFLSQGAASVIISEQLPNNVWETGLYRREPTIFSYYDLQVPPTPISETSY